MRPSKPGERWIRSALCALIAASSVWTSRLDFALAQSSGDAVDDGYKKHMENGVKLAQDKNYDAALVEFYAAYAIRKKPNPLLDIALCYKGLFNYPKAIATLETALDKHADAMEPSDRKASRDAITEMQTLLGFVTIDLFPPQAAVTVDGEAVVGDARTKPIPLGPGTHKIGAQAEGFAAAEQSVTVASSETAHASLRLVADKGYVSVKGDDAAMVIAVDSKAMGTGVWAGLLTPGTHLVEMYEPGRAPYRVNVWVVAGQSQAIRRGAGGIPIAPAGGPVAPVPPPPKADPEPPPPPPKHGPYAMVTGSLLAPTAMPNIFPQGNLTSGAAGGLRAGYRVNTAAAFELMFEYGNVKADRGTDPDANASLSFTRFGLNLRLMTPGSRVRFVGAIGGGIVNDSLHITPSPALTAACTADSGCDIAKLNACTDKSCSGVDPYLLGELGLEFDFSGVILGAAFQSYFQSTKGIANDPYESAPLPVLGGGLRIGYALW